MRAGLAALSQVRRNGSVPLAVARPRLGRLQVGPMQGGDHPIANSWQGVFPVRDTGKDGYVGVAPVGCFGAMSEACAT